MGKQKEKKTPVEKKPMTFNKFWCIWNYVEAGIILVAGVLAIIVGALYNKDNATLASTVTNNVLPFVVGAFIALDAVLRVIMGVKRIGKDTNENIMFVGGFELTAAILVMIFHNDFTRLAIDAISVLLIVIGALLLLFSILSIAQKTKKLFIPVLETLFAAMLVAVGITVLVLYHLQSDNNQIVLIVAGSIFCLFGIAQAIITGITAHKAKKEESGEIAIVDPKEKKADKKPEEKKVVEAEVVEPKQIEEKKPEEPKDSK